VSGAGTEEIDNERRSGRAGERKGSYVIRMGLSSQCAENTTMAAGFVPTNFVPTVAK